MRDPALVDFLNDTSTDSLLDLSVGIQAADSFDLHLAEIEEIALEHDLLPKRYMRNGLSCKQQLRLFRSKISIIGCGGLGGAVAETLARIGFGNLRLVDPDKFEEHNLNRQRFATCDLLGHWKVEAAKARLVRINPALKVIPVKKEFGIEDIKWADVIIDGLDCGQKRLHLATLCDKSEKALIHAAVREWFGQVGVHNKNNALVRNLYQSNPAIKTQPPKVLAPAVSTIANLQVVELCKLLLGIKSPLTTHWLSCNLLDCEFELLPNS